MRLEDMREQFPKMPEIPKEQISGRIDRPIERKDGQ